MSATALGDDDVRHRIEHDLDTTLVVVAGAGTGKTTALVNRIVELVRTGTARMREIAAITFTEAAAAELRERVRVGITEAAARAPHDGVLAQGRDEVDEAAICTLHAFAQRILIEQSVAAGLPPGFEVLDGPSDVADFQSRWSRFADALLDDPSAERFLVRGFTTGLKPDGLDHIAWSLHNHWDRLEDGVIGELEAHAASLRDDAGDDALALTPLIEELDRARALVPWCSSDDDKLLRHVLDVVADARQRLLTAQGDEQAVLAELAHLPTLRCTYGRQENWGGHIDDVRAACQDAESIRAQLLENVRRGVLADVLPRLARFVLAAAEERRSEGRITFHDLLVLARRVLRGGGEAVDALRQRYRHLLVDEFQDTDPLQVELATRLTAALDGEGDEVLRPGALFLVGDPKQSIYRFRRADIELFDRVGAQVGERVVLRTNFRSVPGILDFVNVVFSDLFGEHPGTGQAAHHDLDRSRPGLPATVPVRAHAATGHAATQLTLAGFDDLGADVPGSARRGKVTRPAPGPAPVVVLGGRAGTSALAVRRSAATDAAAMMQQIVGHWPVQGDDGEIRPARWADIAVLIPTRSSLASLEEAFEDLEVPYRLEGAALLWDTDEVRDVLAVLRAVDDPADTVSLLAALRSPGLACGDDDLVTWHHHGGGWDLRTPAPAEQALHPVARAMAVLRALHLRRWWSDPSDMVAMAMEELRSFELALAYRRPRDHWHRLRWLADQARLFDDTAGGTLRSFLRWATLQTENEGYRAGVGPPDPDDDAVRVMTIHGAKGLEFPIVVLAGLEREETSGHQPDPVLWREGELPEVSAGRSFQSAGYEDAKTLDQALDTLERHRLLYVAMTRARDHLVLCLHHKGRNDGPDSSPAATLDVACARHPLLWRRPDVDALARPGAPAPASDGPASAAGRAETPEQWRVRLTQWQAERTELLRSGRRQPVATATAVADAGSAPHPSPGRPSPSSAPDPGWPEVEESAWRNADVALNVGRAVHEALAAVDLAGHADATGRTVADVARERADAHGVGDQGDVVTSMVEAALASDCLQQAAAARHWREMYVGAPVGEIGVVEGYVDLLFEDGDELVVVDYKTDRVGGQAGLDAAAARYRLQLGTYAVAVASATGRRVGRCVLVFVGDGPAREHVLAGGDLESACRQAVEVATALVS